MALPTGTVCHGIVSAGAATATPGTFRVLCAGKRTGTTDIDIIEFAN